VHANMEDEQEDGAVVAPKEEARKDDDGEAELMSALYGEGRTAAAAAGSGGGGGGGTRQLSGAATLALLVLGMVAFTCRPYGQGGLNPLAVYGRPPCAVRPSDGRGRGGEGTEGEGGGPCTPLVQHVFSVSSAEHHAGALATGTHDGVLRSLERNGVAIVRGATVQPAAALDRLREKLTAEAQLLSVPFGILPPR
jgi:hypothetical protein